MQIVSKGNNLHEMSKSIFWIKSKSAEFTHREVKFKVAEYLGNIQ